MMHGQENIKLQELNFRKNWNGILYFQEPPQLALIFEILLLTITFKKSPINSLMFFQLLLCFRYAA